MCVCVCVYVNFQMVGCQYPNPNLLKGLLYLLFKCSFTTIFFSNIIPPQGCDLLTTLEETRST